MKKQIALIIISMLAAMSVTAQNAKCNETCNNRHNIPICELGEGVIQPELDEIFGNCTDCLHCPDFDYSPEVPEAPEAPEVPEVPEAPEAPEAPENPNVGEDNVYESSVAERVLELVNLERAKYGLNGLTYSSRLSNAAQVRAVEIKKLFSHTRPNGSRCFTVLDEVGYKYRTAGENIAYGQSSAEEVMAAWMNSDGHRANILGESYTEIGIGVYEKGGVIYWSQMFAS